MFFDTVWVMFRFYFLYFLTELATRNLIVIWQKLRACSCVLSVNSSVVSSALLAQLQTSLKCQFIKGLTLSKATGTMLKSSLYLEIILFPHISRIVHVPPQYSKLFDELMDSLVARSLTAWVLLIDDCILFTWNISASPVLAVGHQQWKPDF